MTFESHESQTAPRQKTNPHPPILESVPVHCGDPSTPLRMRLAAREARKSGLPLITTTDPIIRNNKYTKRTHLWRVR